VTSVQKDPAELPQRSWARFNRGIIAVGGIAYVPPQVHDRIQDRRRQARDRGTTRRSVYIGREWLTKALRPGVICGSCKMAHRGGGPRRGFTLAALRCLNIHRCFAMPVARSALLLAPRWLGEIGSSTRKELIPRLRAVSK
jgi:hypothetical protein